MRACLNTAALANASTAARFPCTAVAMQKSPVIPRGHKGPDIHFQYNMDKVCQSFTLYKPTQGAPALVSTDLHCSRVAHFNKRYSFLP